jgi:thiamine biosynthesis lipoprotein
MSTYLPDSEISRFNRFRSDEWFPVSSDTATVVAAALEVGKNTAGAFDISVGPLVNLWSFGPHAAPPKVPSEEAIQDAMAKVGLSRIEVRQDPPGLRKTHPDVYLDLSGIAKGFAADAVAELLRRRGLHRFMVEIGGEVRTGGRKIDGSAWRIGIERPLSDTRAIQRVVELEHLALATSGDYRNFFEQDGRRYSHTIDPRSGRPVEHDLASVSVIAETCMFADAMATALVVMGAERAFRYAQENALDVLLIVRESSGFAERATAGFDKRICHEEPVP